MNKAICVEIHHGSWQRLYENIVPSKLLRACFSVQCLLPNLTSYLPPGLIFGHLGDSVPQFYQPVSALSPGVVGLWVTSSLTSGCSFCSVWLLWIKVNKVFRACHYQSLDMMGGTAPLAPSHKALCLSPQTIFFK